MRRVDVVVIGVGIMGAAAGRSLARAGREVLMLERFEVGHRRGSSHGRSRVFRLSYDDPEFVRLAREALGLWRELEDEAGEPLLHTTGVLELGAAIEANRAALEACGEGFELLDGAEAGVRFPGVALPAGEPVLFQADAGWVAADRAWSAFVKSAVNHGAELREGERVTDVLPLADAVEIRTEEETYRTGTAVVTAGAWANGLLAPTGIDLPTTVTRETVTYFSVPDAGQLPILIEWRTPVAYALPDPGRGIKAAEHHAGAVTGPEEEGRPDAESVARLESWIADRIPAAAERPPETETCLYTNTTDERFILERHGPLVVGSPCSGHGFKFAPAIGGRLAALAVP